MTICAAAVLALLAMSGASSGFCADPIEYQQKQQDYPEEAFGYPLIQFDLKGERPQISYLRFEKASGGTLTRFDAQPVSAGKELGIRGYWISKSLIDAYRAKLGTKGFEKGPGAPTYDDILKSFRSADSKAFGDTVSRLDEIRRNPENPDEVTKVRNALDPKRKSDPKDYLDRAWIGTGMIEVEDSASAESRRGNRRFIPLSLVLSGRIAVDPGRARVKILKSVVLSIVSDSLLQNKEKLKSSLEQTLATLECRASPCATQGVVFSQILEALLKAATADHATRFNVMDPKYDEKLERAEREKLERVLRDLKSLCLP